MNTELTNRHPDAIAWEKWLAENPSTADPMTLEASERFRVYLENRLIRAWEAGRDYGRNTPELKD